MVTEEEKRQFLKNEERLWDMAALTVAPTIFQLLTKDDPRLVNSLVVAELSYELADALMDERKERLKEPKKF